MISVSRLAFACAMAAGPMSVVSTATDFTFFTTSDIHYGWEGPDRGGDRDSVRAAMPGLLNALPGTRYPDGSETVAAPKGVLIPGDLIHWEDTTLWRRYITDYAVGGTGKVKFPIYDGSGNHEVQDQRNILGPLFVKRTAERKARFGLTDTDPLGYHYSWDWEGVHFVNLNLCPGATTTDNLWNGPAGSIAFLERDLAQHVGVSGRPIFLMHHLPYNDTTYTPDYSEGWVTGARDRLFRTLKGYNVIGILHGHTHFYPSVYQYRGVDIFDDGANMAGDALVFRIANGKLKVNNRSLGKWGSVRYVKDISMGIPAELKPDKAGSPRFRFSLIGKGILYSGFEPVDRVEVFGMDGRRAGDFRVKSPDAVWSGRDGAGRLLPKGLWLLRFRGPGTAAQVRVLID